MLTGVSIVVDYLPDWSCSGIEFGDSHKSALSSLLHNSMTSTHAHMGARPVMGAALKTSLKVIA